MKITLKDIGDFFGIVLAALIILVLAIIPFIVLGIGIAFVILIVWWVLKIFGVIALVGLV